MFETELQFFIDHQDELVAQYSDQVLVLRGNRVVDVQPTLMEAYLAALEEYEPGTFMLQHCIAGPEAYTVTVQHHI